MSIINEALKKTEQSIQQNEAKKSSFLNKKPALNPVLLYVLILLIGVFLSNSIFNLLGHRVKDTQSFKKALPVVHRAPVSPSLSLPVNSALVVKEEKTGLKEPVFVLNGIFFSDNDGYALINNQIVRENERIGAARVRRITENTVELEERGNFITLSAAR